jgi:hypothetical protein
VLRLTRAGFGTSWAAAPAILTAADRAKDLGVINVPPVITGAVLGLMHSYPSLFARPGWRRSGRSDNYPGPFCPLTTVAGPGRDIYSKRALV